MPPPEHLSDEQLLQQAARQLFEERVFRLVYRGARIGPGGYHYIADGEERRVLSMNAEAAGLTAYVQDGGPVRGIALPGAEFLLQESGQSDEIARRCVHRLLTELFESSVDV